MTLRGYTHATSDNLDYDHFFSGEGELAVRALYVHIHKSEEICCSSCFRHLRLPLIAMSSPKLILAILELFMLKCPACNPLPCQPGCPWYPDSIPGHQLDSPDVRIRLSKWRREKMETKLTKAIKWLFTIKDELKELRKKPRRAPPDQVWLPIYNLALVKNRLRSALVNLKSFFGKASRTWMWRPCQWIGWFFADHEIGSESSFWTETPGIYSDVTQKVTTFSAPRFFPEPDDLG